ncbi:uncharacterized protein YpmB [Anoxybacillus tengchongensis]|uniref:Uncharacterized protein YpmB n=1 Tax=Anoxybacillus tengchongensis TaxID=576944 RepID=A0A7W9YPZ9_9BACL|nr:hypothetical protein [Anoxybacillus tengchongensis]MBB6176070.1 uncharacterized protein YpmB [Anoxybacillus tengchongensis]
MNKKLLTAILLTTLFFGNACSQTKEVNQDTKRTAQEKHNTQSKKQSAVEEVTALVLDHTKIVKIINIRKNVNPNYQELGPFFVVTGIDKKGRKSEVWINNGKIYDVQ